MNIADRFARKKSQNLRSEINVTPMVDVMLVLLIIFMITSPMIVAGINVDLPKTKSAPISSSKSPLTLSINAKGEIYLFETRVKSTNLVSKLKEITKENKETAIFVKGDRKIDYGTVVSVISELKQAGFTKVSLISDIKT